MATPFASHNIELAVNIRLSSEGDAIARLSNDTASIKGYVHLSKGKRLSDLLNDHRGFLPVKVNGKIIIVNKAWMVLIEEA